MITTTTTHRSQQPPKVKVIETTCVEGIKKTCSKSQEREREREREREMSFSRKKKIWIKEQNMKST